MEIITLIRSNIRHKKGSFKSIIMLMMIISLSVSTNNPRTGKRYASCVQCEGTEQEPHPADGNRNVGEQSGGSLHG